MKALKSSLGRSGFPAVATWPGRLSRATAREHGPREGVRLAGAGNALEARSKARRAAPRGGTGRREQPASPWAGGAREPGRAQAHRGRHHRHSRCVDAPRRRPSGRGGCDRRRSRVAGAWPRPRIQRPPQWVPRLRAGAGPSGPPRAVLRGARGPLGRRSRRRAWGRGRASVAPRGGGRRAGGWWPFGVAACASAFGHGRAAPRTHGRSSLRARSGPLRATGAATGPSARFGGREAAPTAASASQGAGERVARPATVAMCVGGARAPSNVGSHLQVGRTTRSLVPSGA